MTNFVVHAGFSKTGTTTLQKCLFSRHSQIVYLGKPYDSDSMASEIEALIHRDSLGPELSLKEIQHRLAQPSEKKVTLLSDERLVSFSKIRDKGLVARRIKDMLGANKVIFTIRNQYDILKSAYLSGGRILLHVPEPYSGRFVDFQEWIFFSRQNLERSLLGHVNYYRTIEYYIRLFGRENVCVMLHEEMVNRQDFFLEKLSGFLGIDFLKSKDLMTGGHHNRDITMIQLDFERFKNRFFLPRQSKFSHRLAKGLHRIKCIFSDPQKTELKIPDNVMKWMVGYYREGNVELMKRFDLQLGAWGYPL